MFTRYLHGVTVLHDVHAGRRHSGAVLKGDVHPAELQLATTTAGGGSSSVPWAAERHAQVHTDSWDWLVCVGRLRVWKDEHSCISIIKRLYLWTVCFCLFVRCVYVRFQPTAALSNPPRFPLCDLSLNIIVSVPIFVLRVWSTWGDPVRFTGL